MLQIEKIARGSGGGVTEKKKDSKNFEASQDGWRSKGPIILRSELDTNTRAESDKIARITKISTNSFGAGGLHASRGATMGLHGAWDCASTSGRKDASPLSNEAKEVQF